MKAWIVVQNGPPAQALALQDVAAPLADGALPSGANVLVRVTHAALNPADLHFMLTIPSWLPMRRRPVAGLDFAGVVERLGPGAVEAARVADAEAASQEETGSAGTSNEPAPPLSVGMRVCGSMSVGLVATGHGALAERVVVPAALLVRVPPGLASSAPGLAAGVLGVAGQTAHLVLTHAAAKAALAAAATADPPRQPRVLVHGASGGVGSLLVAAAKACAGGGGAFVVAVCSAANAAYATDTLGADAVLDYQAHAPLPEYLAAQHDDGHPPYDLIVDCVGDDALFRRSPAFLQPRGAFLSIVGGPGSGLAPLLRHALRPVVLGGTPRTYRLLALAPSGARARRVAAWVRHGTIPVVPAVHAYAMADAVAAYERLAEKHTRGKIVVRVAEEGEE